MLSTICFSTLLLGEHVDRGGAELSSDAEDGAVDLRQVLGFGVAFHTLHLGLFGVNGVDSALEVALEEVLQGLSTRFVNIAGSTTNDDAAGVQ